MAPKYEDIKAQLTEAERTVNQRKLSLILSRQQVLTLAREIGAAGVTLPSDQVTLIHFWDSDTGGWDMRPRAANLSALAASESVLENGTDLSASWAPSELRRKMTVAYGNHLSDTLLGDFRGSDDQATREMADWSASMQTKLAGLAIADAEAEKAEKILQARQMDMERVFTRIPTSEQIAWEAAKAGGLDINAPDFDWPDSDTIALDKLRSQIDLTQKSVREAKFLCATADDARSAQLQRTKEAVFVAREMNVTLPEEATALVGWWEADDVSVNLDDLSKRLCEAAGTICAPDGSDWVSSGDPEERRRKMTQVYTGAVRRTMITSLCATDSLVANQQANCLEILQQQLCSLAEKDERSATTRSALAIHEAALSSLMVDLPTFEETSRLSAEAKADARQRAKLLDERGPAALAVLAERETVEASGGQTTVSDDSV